MICTTNSLAWLFLEERYPGILEDAGHDATRSASPLDYPAA